MKYAMISDIHGNLEALIAVLNDIRGKSVDSIICLGDIVGYYPDPERCVELIRENVDLCVAGNHDYAAIGKIDTQNFTFHAFAAMEWTKQNISSIAQEYLSSLPLTIEKDEMFFTHSSPSNPQEWVYVFPDSEDAVFEAFNSLVHPLNFIGHTHWPSILIQDEEKIILHSDHRIEIDKDNYYLINVGSVGQPRDFDSRSCYAIYDSETSEINLFRVNYDYRETQKKIRENHLPLFLAERLEKGR
ncbi:MAG TPA: metallophosphoesterase family protein [Chitinispirillaceae bacterium]|nr:metallophosphoesterase family protein [Chitinispirillaceae bacterium]